MIKPIDDTGARADASLRVAGVSFSYGPRQPALQDVSFEVRPGRLTLLLGPNGAGKTTLFGLITGLLGLRTGSISIAGRSLRENGSSALEPLGIVFQQTTLDLDLTVRQNLRYFAALRGTSRREADERMAEELAAFDMAERLDDRVRTLNGGHRRRVEIARALMARPAILLLDEPTVGLDVPSRTFIIERLHARAEEGGLSILWATHLLDEARPGDRIIVLHRGRVVAEDEMTSLVAAERASGLGEAFNRLTAEAV